MNSTLFGYCENNLRFIGNGKLKENPSLRKLNKEYGFGRIEHGFCYFCEKDKLQLIALVKQELNGVHLFRDAYPELQSRIQRASHHRDEKQGAFKVTEDFILLNSLGALRLNNQISNNLALGSLGQFICATDINSIEHEQIILVENLQIMANLARLNIPSSLDNALWLYRGDQKKQQQTGTADQFFSRFKNSHQLIYFGDFDPAGLQIALTCGATQWLTLNDKSALEIDLLGFEDNWFKQAPQKVFINKQTLTPAISELYTHMNRHQKTLMQEHMLAHHLPLRSYTLK